MAFYTRAADLWPRARTTRDSPLDRAELFGRAAAAAHVTGDIARAITLARHALAELGASADRLRTGALLARIARYHWDLPDNTGAMTIIEQAVDAVSEQPPTAERATVLATHSRLLLLAGRIDEARARSDEAIAVARHVGARAEEGQALNTLGVAYGDLGDVDLAIARLEEARRVAEEVGAPQELCSVHHNLATTLVGFGRHTEAVTVGLTACRLARRFGLMRGAGAHTQANMAGTLLWLGRWDEADRLLAEILDLDLPAVNLVIGVLTRARARLWRGDVDGARDDLTRDEVATVVSQEPAIATDLYILLAELNTWRGRFAEARTAVRDGLVVAAGAAPVVGVCLTGISAEAAAAEHARARHAADEADAAVESAARLRELAHRTADDRGDACPPFVTAMLCAANAEWTRARGPSSAESWGVAADAWDQESFPYPAAYARWRQAEALLAGGPRHQAATTAAPILAAARQTAERLGARRLISEIESLARRARVDLHPATADTDRTAEPAKEPIANLRLTPREREVLELLAEGLTNRQIADRLYISDKTASVHVSNILTKLGVANRGQAAATAHRLGLTP